MHVTARTVESVGHDGALEPARVGWFAARQPGILRFVEERLGAGDAFAVAVDGAWHVTAAFEAHDGVPPARLERSLLERAEAAVRAEAARRRPVADGCADRQPELCRWVADYLADPPAPLSAAEVEAAAAALLAIVYALDERTRGRPVP